MKNRDLQAQLCRGKHGSHVFSHLPFPISSVPVRLALWKQPKVWHHCKPFLGPNSGTKTAARCNIKHSSVMPYSVHSEHGEPLGSIWLMLDPALCSGFHETCLCAPLLWAHVYFLELGAHLGPTLAEIIISTKYLPEGIVWKNLLWCGLYFCRVINLGKSCFYLFSASKILCQ